MPAPELPAGVTQAQVNAGRGLFNNGACQRCHGGNGAGGANGPSLVRGPWLHADGTIPSLIRVIATGVPANALKDRSRQFPMNPRGGPMNLSDGEVRDLAAYVWSISRQKR